MHPAYVSHDDMVDASLYMGPALARILLTAACLASELLADVIFKSQLQCLQECSSELTAATAVRDSAVSPCLCPARVPL